MAEAHPRGDHQGSGLLGRVAGLGTQPEDRAGAQDQRRVAGRVGRRQHQQQARRGGQRFQPCEKARFDPALQRHRAGQREAAGELGRAERARQLLQRERVAARFGDQLVAHTPVDRAGQRPAQQGVRVVVAQARHGQLRQIGETLIDLAHGQNDRDALGVQTSGDERDRTGGHLVQPLGVVDDAQQRRSPATSASRSEHGQPDEERVGRVPARRPKAASSASRWGAGRLAPASIMGPQSSCSPA